VRTRKRPTLFFGPHPPSLYGGKRKTFRTAVGRACGAQFVVEFTAPGRIVAVMPEELSREQFVQRVIEHVRVKFPLVKLARGEQPFSMNVNGNLAPLENLYRVSVLRPEDLERHVDRWMVELLRAAEGTPDQSGDFEQIKDRILPMVLSSSTTELKTDAMVTQPLIDGLIVAYALDSDRTISYIPRVCSTSGRCRSTTSTRSRSRTSSPRARRSTRTRRRTRAARST
jgi:hypothetical protein